VRQTSKKHKKTRVQRVFLWVDPPLFNSVKHERRGPRKRVDRARTWQGGSLFAAFTADAWL
jgi:hypothetical protein